MEDLKTKYTKLVDLIQLTESITTKIHGVLDKDEIFKIIEFEFRKSKNYQILLLLLSEDNRIFNIKTVTIPDMKLKLIEKFMGTSLNSFKMEVDKISILHRVIEKGDTYYFKTIELTKQVIPGPVGYIVAKITGHDKKTTIVSPLKLRDKIIGVFAIDSPDLIDYFIHSVKNLTQNISVALELAEEIAIGEKVKNDLLHSETKFRTLYDSTTDAVMLLNEKGFFDCNPATLKMFGCETKKEFCTKHPADLSPQQQPCGTDSMTLASQQIAKAMENGSNSFEWVHKQSGSEKTFYADVLLSRMELDGNLVLQATVRDISERKQTEIKIIKLNETLEQKVIERTEQLVETNKYLIHEIEERKKTENLLLKSYERYETLIKTTQDGFWVADIEGRFLEVNDEYCSMIEYSKEQLLTMRISDIEAAETEEITRKHIEKIIEQGWDRFETRHRCACGKIIDVEISVTYIQAEKLFLVFIHNITQRKQFEKALNLTNKKLAELNTTKDKFFSIIAHDLKNPFAGLLSSYELLKRSIVKQDMNKIEKNADSIYTSSIKAYSILEDLLNWARLQMGKCEVKKEKFNIHYLISDVVDGLQSIAYAKEIEIIIKGSEKAVAFFDMEMFKMLIRNLATNAIKFSNNGDNIIVDINEFNEKLYKISVKDSGVGINEKDLTKLFRIDVSHTTYGTANEKGTGLGLILCKEFADKNGSEIFVESEEGKGSTFSFTAEKTIESEKL